MAELSLYGLHLVEVPLGHLVLLPLVPGLAGAHQVRYPF